MSKRDTWIGAGVVFGFASAQSPWCIKELVAQAERHCYVLGTLRRAAKGSGRIVLDGALSMEFTHPLA